MNVKAAVYSMLTSRPAPLQEVVSRLPYAKKTVYNAVEQMVKDGDLLSERRHNGALVISIPKDYYHQQLSLLHLFLVTLGIDPTPFLSTTCQRIWRSTTKEEITSEQISHKTGFTAVTVRNYLHLLADADALTIIKKKPFTVQKNKSSELTRLLESIHRDEKTHNDVMFIPGSRPFDERFLSPEDLKRSIYDHPEQSMSITGTGFQLKGKGRHIVYESIKDYQDFEHIFLFSLFTSVGVEERCLWIIKSEKFDMKKLFDYAQKQNIVNIVGCYLHIIHDISADLVDKKAIEMFSKASNGKRTVFLKQLKQYGKQGWEVPYEKRWNVDLYLDLGAIKHGVRSV